MRPIISVCLASYNGEKFIRQQLSSILSQLGENDELIISDDSSKDRTISLISDLNDRRIKLISHQSFKNPIYNFENALRHANGEFIFLSDQDDLWVEGKVQFILNDLKRFDLVVTDCQIIDNNDKLLHESFYVINNSKKGFLNNLWSNSYLGCCMAFRKEVLRLALPFPKKIPMHDWWLGLVGELFYKTHFSKKRLVLYRRHDQNASSTSEKSTNSFVIKLSFRFRLLWELLRLYWSRKYSC